MESDSDFDGFEDRDIIETENRLLELNEGGSDFSDIEFSDLEEGDETESEDDQGPPNPPQQNGNLQERAPQWTATLTHVDKRDFRGPSPGPTKTLSAEKEELDFFSLFFPEEIFNLIVAETNRYATAGGVLTPSGLQ